MKRANIIPIKKSEFTFPELMRADNYLSNPNNPRQKYIIPGQEESAFGSMMKHPQFKKELRRLQSKHKLKGLA